MNAKQIIAFAAIAFAGTAAMADDITVANEAFTAQKTRAEVRAEVVNARKTGQFVAVDEQYAAPEMAATKSDLTREQVRAELRNSPKARVVVFNPAA